MPSGRRRFVLRHPVVVDIGCGCRRPKLPSFLSCSPKPKQGKASCLLSPSTTTSHWETSFTGTTTRSTTTTTATCGNSSSPSRYGDYPSSPSSAFYAPETPKRAGARGQRNPSKKKNKCAAAAEAKKGLVEGSVPVVKESSDPYLDFRDSMLQMIVEMEIYAWEDLRDLLHRFLALNAPRHHHLILRAFAEIWNGLFSPSSCASPSASASAARRRRRR